MGEGESRGDQPRDVRNHLLFEIATEVAHRGTSKPRHASSQLPADYAGVMGRVFELIMALMGSGWNLHRHQVEGPRYLS